MIATHVLNDRDFGLLAAGGGDATTIQTLLASEYSRRALLVQAVLQSARRTAPSTVAALDEAYRLLADIQRVDEGIIRSALTMPDAGIWIVECLRRGSARREQTYRYLACIAAAAALRVGHEFEIDVPVLNGVVPLPALGTAIFSGMGGRTARIGSGGSAGQTSVVLAETGQRIVLPVDHAIEAPGWRPARVLEASTDECAVSIWLDDFSPYRTPRGLERAPPVTASQAARWQSALEEAWQLLVRQLPRQARAISAGLRVLIPLRTRSCGLSDSATAADAFGAAMLTAPQDGQGLALALLHEFQHGKLAAVQNLVTLHTSGPQACRYAPWRDDPRPLDALLHGAYAHLAVAEFWRSVAHRGGNGNALLAQEHFAYWCGVVREALNQLETSGELTAAGNRFAAGMTETLDQLQAESLPVQTLQFAADRQISDRIAWRMRHLQPDPSAVDRLARAWLAGSRRPPGTPTVSSTVCPGPRAAIGSTRQLLARHLALFPDEPKPSQSADAEPTAADLTYARGQYAAALADYRGELAREPAEPGAWAGLVLTLRRLGQHQERQAPLSAGLGWLVDRPEVVRAVCAQISALSGRHPDPIMLAVWLGQLGVDSGMR